MFTFTCFLFKCENSYQLTPPPPKKNLLEDSHYPSPAQNNKFLISNPKNLNTSLSPPQPVLCMQNITFKNSTQFQIWMREREKRINYPIIDYYDCYKLLITNEFLI